MIKRLRSIAYDDKGETLVEIMVAFVVLLMVVAIFTGTVHSASVAITRSINMRRNTDTIYNNLKNALDTETRTGVVATSGSAKRTGASVATNEITLTDGSKITLNAYQYNSVEDSDSTIYWILR